MDSDIEHVAVVQLAGDDGLGKGSACVDRKLLEDFLVHFEDVETGGGACINLAGHSKLVVNHYTKVLTLACRVGCGSGFCGPPGGVP